MHVLNSRQYSGAENVAITIINNMRSQVDSVYVSPAGLIKEYLDEAGIRYFPVKKLSYREMKRAIKEIKPDIIHAHDFTAGIMVVVTTMFLFRTKIPIVNHLHNDPPWIKHYNLRGIIYALSCLMYKKILTVSESVMNEYVFGKLFKYKTEIIGNPIDIERIRRRANDNNYADYSNYSNYAEHSKLDEQYHKDYTKRDKTSINTYDISFLGRFSLQKNPFLFLDIIAEVKKFKPDISVIMIGDGELRLEVEKKIRELELGENIELVGFQKNPYKFLNQAKILLMPSSWEGFGLAAVEALALGKPVVCSTFGGLPSIVTEKCGSICSEVDEYVDTIISLLKNKDEWKAKSSEAMKRANELSDIESYKKTILKIYYNCFNFINAGEKPCS